VPPVGAVLREGRHGVVVMVDGPVRVLGADSQQVGVGRRVGEGADVAAVVADRDDHDDAVLPGLLGGVRQRVELVGLHRVRAQREVEDADVHPVVVRVLGHPVDARDHLRDVGGTGGRTDLDAHQASLGGDALVAVRGAVVAGDDPGERGAMAVAVPVRRVRVL
jgi:hypothetical protein